MILCLYLFCLGICSWPSFNLNTKNSARNSFHFSSLFFCLPLSTIGKELTKNKWPSQKRVRKVGKHLFICFSYELPLSLLWWWGWKDKHYSFKHRISPLQRVCSGKGRLIESACLPGNDLMTLITSLRLGNNTLYKYNLKRSTSKDKSRKFRVALHTSTPQ